MKATADYRCKAINSVVDQLIGGPQDVRVHLAGKFPTVLASGQIARVRKFRARLTLSRRLVRKLKHEQGVKRVAANAGARYLVGKSNHGKPIGLVVKWQGRQEYVRSNHKRGRFVRLRLGHKNVTYSPGRVKVRAPQSAERLVVLLPKHLGYVQHYRMPLVMGGKKQPWKCSVAGKGKQKDRRLGVIKVR